MWYSSHCHYQTCRLCDGSPYRPNWRWMRNSGNKMWQVNDVNSLYTAYFQSSFVSSILLEWIMSVRLPASAVGCQTGTGKYQNTPCMAAWPSLTNSHTHLLLTSEEVRSQTKRCSSKHKHCFRTFQPRTQHIFFPRKSYVLFFRQWNM